MYIYYQAVGSSKPKAFYSTYIHTYIHTNSTTTILRKQQHKYKYRLLLVLPSSSSSFAYGEAVRRNFLHSMRVLLNIGTSGIGAKYIGWRWNWLHNCRDPPKCNMNKFQINQLTLLKSIFLIIIGQDLFQFREEHVAQMSLRQIAKK